MKMKYLSKLPDKLVYTYGLVQTTEVWEIVSRKWQEKWFRIILCEWSLQVQRAEVQNLVNSFSSRLISDIVIIKVIIIINVLAVDSLPGLITPNC